MRPLLIAVVSLASLSFAALQPRYAQPLAYHQFADERLVLGIPNFWNVASNLPFLVLGVWGCLLVVHGSVARGLIERRERWSWLVFFAGVALTCFGSIHYHLAPSNQTLLWDRLPMSIAFMALLAAVTSERAGVGLGTALLLPLCGIGLGSVWYWNLTELHDRGDLRPYLLVQFLPLLVIPLLLLLYPPRYSGAPALVAALVLYLLAKLLELADGAIFGLGAILSGHTLKHLTAAIAIFVLVRMLRARHPSAAGEEG